LKENTIIAIVWSKYLSLQILIYDYRRGLNCAALLPTYRDHTLDLCLVGGGTVHGEQRISQ